MSTRTERTLKMVTFGSRFIDGAIKIASSSDSSTYYYCRCDALLQLCGVLVFAITLPTLRYKHSVTVTNTGLLLLTLCY